MSYDIRLVKLVTGEVVVGKYNEAGKTLDEVATMQTVPTKEGGVQMMMIPYGYPFEQNFAASIPFDKFIYVFTNTPEELQTKYIELSTNLTIQKSNIIT